MELTKENWRLGVIQGRLIDADGTLLYGWNAELNQPQAAEVNYDLLNANPASGPLRQLCNQVVCRIKRTLLGVGGDND
jgi:hypothetical protein